MPKIKEAIPTISNILTMIDQQLFVMIIFLSSSSASIIKSAISIWLSWALILKKIDNNTESIEITNNDHPIAKYAISFLEFKELVDKIDK